MISRGCARCAFLERLIYTKEIVMEAVDMRDGELCVALVEAIEIAWRRGRGEFRPEDGDRLVALRRLVPKRDPE